MQRRTTKNVHVLVSGNTVQSNFNFCLVINTDHHCINQYTNQFICFIGMHLIKGTLL